MSERLRLDSEMQRRGIAPTRSQAENYIRLGKVKVNGKVVTKPGHFILPETEIILDVAEQYVSRAGMKLDSVAEMLNLDFKDKVILDVGSSTGGFTDYSLKHGAKLVYAVDVGTKQLHPSLHGNSQIELHEQTDIRDFIPSITPDIILMDVSFVSSRQLLPHLAKKASNPNTQFVIMVKPQFEADRNQVNKGVIKNDSMRRKILSDFENWTKDLFVIKDKKDSEVAGAKGNRERFYLLKKST